MAVQRTVPGVDIWRYYVGIIRGRSANYIFWLDIFSLSPLFSHARPHTLRTSNSLLSTQAHFLYGCIMFNFRRSAFENYRFSLFFVSPFRLFRGIFSITSPKHMFTAQRLVLYTHGGAAHSSRCRYMVILRRDHAGEVGKVDFSHFNFFALFDIFEVFRS